MDSDDDVLLENDPLAIYLKNQKFSDFETRKMNPESNQNKMGNLKTNSYKIYYCYEDLRMCCQYILNSELLLEEDHHILESHYSNNDYPGQNIFFYKIVLSSSFSLLSSILIKYCNLKFLNILYPISISPVMYLAYKFLKRKIENNKISLLLQTLKKLTNTAKKCLKLAGEYSATIGYYSSATMNTSTISNAYVRFAQQLYALLLSIIKLITTNSTEILFTVPLNIERNFKFNINEKLFCIKEEVNMSDLKLLFELYLLIQSDFIKTMGLSMCQNLWTNPNCNINKILSNNIPLLINLLNENIAELERNYNFLTNYGTKSNNKSLKSPRKCSNTPSNFINSCLHNAEIHFQHLMCKTKDLQNIIHDTDLDNINDKGEIITIMLKEMENQMNSSKTMIEAATKYITLLQNKPTEPEAKVTMPQSPNLKTVENQEEELIKQEKLTYELYIPKEGLDLSELEVDIQQPIVCIKDLDYSGVLLNELRTILKARNPDVFEENTRKPEIISDSESEDEFYNSYKRNIFRPTRQPLGLAENLQTIEHVLQARMNLLKCEEICGDTSDIED